MSGPPDQSTSLRPELLNGVLRAPNGGDASDSNLKNSQFTLSKLSTLAEDGLPRHDRAPHRGDMRRIIAIVLGWLVLPMLLPMPRAQAGPGRFDWPLHPRPQLERRFDRPVHDWLPGHRGVDLGGAAGQPVLAAGDGFVVFAGEVAGKPVVSVDHAGGLRTTYEPVRASVTVGRRVFRGEVLGVLEAGHPGCARACLHWGARRGREYLDPLGLIRRAPLRLEPVRPEQGQPPRSAAGRGVTAARRSAPRPRARRVRASTGGRSPRCGHAANTPRSRRDRRGRLAPCGYTGAARA